MIDRFIVMSDMHLRADRPRCRLDKDWIQTQKDMLSFIAKEANERDCPVCIIGDIFHTSTVPNKIINMFLKFAYSIDKGIYITAGQHDLLYHSIENIDEGSFGVVNTILQSNEKQINFLGDIGLSAYWNGEIIGKNEKYLFLHTLVFEDEKSMPPNKKARTAQQMLNDYPLPKYIFTGDMHRGFDYHGDNGRILINCGCMIRQASDYKDYRPRIYYFSPEYHEAIYLPDIELLVDDSHIIEMSERDERTDNFGGALERTRGDISMDFKENILDEMKVYVFSGKQTKKIIIDLVGI